MKRLNIKELHRRFEEKEIGVVEYVEGIFDRIEAQDNNTFITLNREGALKKAAELDEKLATGAPLGKLWGIPFAFKDNISTKGLRMTCASKVLENFEPIYDATVAKRIAEEDGILIGKANMDEFAMGSSSETSFFGPVRNPLNRDLVPGGSSSGCAAAVAGGEALIGIGTDTGGSSRQPASYCNIVGYMPTYGTISRYGVASMANTMDHVAVLANSVEDAVTTVNVIGGADEKDATSTDEKTPGFVLNEDYDFRGKKIAIPKNLDEFDIEAEVLADFEAGVEEFRKLGAEIEEVEFRYLKYASATYHVLMCCEVSSNMSRYDGIRYGYLTGEYEETSDLYANTRSESFGEEVQRRIAFGTLYLSAENGQAVYKQGLKLRTLIRRELIDILSGCEFLLTPTANNLPYEIGSRFEDPLSMYASGDFNVPVNLAGLCAVSVPVREGISGSLQLIGAPFADEKILQAAYRFERRGNHGI